MVSGSNQQRIRWIVKAIAAEKLREREYTLSPSFEKPPSNQFLSQERSVFLMVSVSAFRSTVHCYLSFLLTQISRKNIN